MLVAAMNPCPCGFSTDPYKQCICTTRQLRQYRQKISGPLLDRIDIQVQVPRLLPEELIGKKAGETSNKIRKRVEKARKIQIKRNAKYGFSLNSYIPAKKLSDLCSLNNNATSVLLSAARKFELSARGYDKIIRIARTIADLANKKDIEVEHVAEALQYRTQDIFGKTLS
jgi:magnesium chelatase family protein